MSPVVRVAVAAGLVAGLFLVFALVSPENRDASDATVVEPYDSSFVDLWVRGCVSSGNSGAFCRCAIDEYTTRLQPFEFEIAAAVAQSDGQVSELPDHLRDVVADVERDCR
jgi:hypothetical protein